VQPDPSLKKKGEPLSQWGKSAARKVAKWRLQGAGSRDTRYRSGERGKTRTLLRAIPISVESVIGREKRNSCFLSSGCRLGPKKFTRSRRQVRKRSRRIDELREKENILAFWSNRISSIGGRRGLLPHDLGRKCLSRWGGKGSFRIKTKSRNSRAGSKKKKITSREALEKRGGGWRVVWKKEDVSIVSAKERSLAYA